MTSIGTIPTLAAVRKCIDNVREARLSTPDKHVDKFLIDAHAALVMATQALQGRVR